MTLSQWMLVLAIVLVIEGIGPLLFPNRWRNYLRELTAMENNALQRVGGALVTAGIVLLIIFS
ncbi:DUF2065 domain-containing protein [Shewanella sp. NIFS-20-20]|uniref:DUF2065 domain-containing protein n=1 Tax=Shewanella sp. NIFS-20-20 TaxID=2853806 RepID=UPI001C4665D6|nr:DUF2065 domain-containing protein [Shewanella sp. NIFS-20-20]MBV7316174.1 DUF2065 domain-containing protein [Shewanella sp. NIFS-20-20]